MGPADSHRVARAPRYSGYRQHNGRLRVRSYHALRPGFPARSARRPLYLMAALQPPPRRNAPGLGYSPFARRYWGNHSYFLFLRVLRCFSSPRWPPDKAGCRPFRATGYPIRTPADQRTFAPSRRFSQLITSFIASGSQGIHHAPLSDFLRGNPDFRMKPGNPARVSSI